MERPVLQAINGALRRKGLRPADRVTVAGLKLLLDGTVARDGSAWRAGNKNRQWLLADAWCAVVPVSTPEAMRRVCLSVMPCMPVPLSLFTFEQASLCADMILDL